MRKLVAIIIAVIVVIVAIPVFSFYIVLSPFIDMVQEIDEINSLDVEKVTSEMMMHPEVVAYVAKHPQYTEEFNNLGVGGTELILISEYGQLTIWHDADGSYVNAIYICFHPDGSSDSASGSDVAEQIPQMC